VPVPIFCVLQCCVRYLLDRECPECVGTKRHRASPPDVTCNGSPSRVKQRYVQDVRFSLTIFSVPARAKSRLYTTRSGLSLRSNQDRSIALGVRLLRPSRSFPSVELSVLSLRSNRDRRIAPGVRLLRPNRGLAPRQAVFLFGQIETDASLQACAYSGRIVASLRVKRFFSSVKSRPTHRSRRALTPAESWPRSASSGFSLRSNRDRRIAPGVRLLRPNRGLTPRQAVFLFGHDNK
jgi:hypothetical protein